MSVGGSGTSSEAGAVSRVLFDTPLVQKEDGRYHGELNAVMALIGKGRLQAGALFLSKSGSTLSLSVDAVDRLETAEKVTQAAGDVLPKTGVAG